MSDFSCDTDPALRDLLLKLHKGATASFNGKKTAQVLALFPGWTIEQIVSLKPTCEIRDFERRVAFWLTDEHGEQAVRLHAHAPRGSTTLCEKSFYGATAAKAMHARIAQYAVDVLPDARTVKADQFVVMNLSEITTETCKDRHVWTFDLFRKVKVTKITAPDGQSFDVCGPVQVLGYGGTKTFADFLTWALQNTDLEAAVNRCLGLTKHIPASERPRVPAEGQTLGTCAICLRRQVVRKSVMVNHGYERPGYGWIVGECFGCGYDPIEVSAKACVAYIPVVEATKTGLESKLVALTTGKVTEFSESRRNFRTGNDEVIVTRQGDQGFDRMLASAIATTERQIRDATAFINELQERITEWKPGKLISTSQQVLS